MLAPRIRVNGIGPGPTLPPKGQSMQGFADRCALLPLQRPASLGEICQTVQFLLSVKSITGQMIALDGGDHLAPQPAHPHPLAN
jgi:NAD(P)-dependent dehydrogenase (short-subunit alcohol dehydrogenase family)